MAIESIPNLRILCNRTSIKILAWDVTPHDAGGRLSPSPLLCFPNRDFSRHARRAYKGV